MTATPPDRSLNQRFAALAEANRIRAYRATVKRDLAACHRTFLSLFDDPDLETAKLVDLLAALPKLGPAKISRVLILADISASKTIAGLTPRQRNALAFTITRVSPSYPAPTDRTAA